MILLRPGEYMQTSVMQITYKNLVQMAVVIYPMHSQMCARLFLLAFIMLSQKHVRECKWQKDMGGNNTAHAESICDIEDGSFVPWGWSPGAQQGTFGLWQ